MPGWIPKVMVSPHMWISAGLFLVVSSLAIGYYRDQQAATVELARKLETPPPVAIQDFARSKNVNMLNETHVLGETDPDDAVTIDIGTGDARERFVLLPLYPVSAGARTNALRYLAAARGDPGPVGPRPVARPVRDEPEVPVAVLVYKQRPGDRRLTGFGAFGLRMLGKGFDGYLVAIEGALFARTFWQDLMTGGTLDAALTRISGDATRSLPLISPYPVGREITGAAPRLARLQRYHLATGIALILLGIGLSVRTMLPEWPRRPTQSLPKRELSATSGVMAGSVAAFEPIASQDELFEADTAARDCDGQVQETGVRAMARQLAARVIPLRNPR